MESTDSLRSLRTAHEGLVVRVRALSAAQYLEPMGGWTPRDVVAHLVGWNRFMIQACRSILAGEPPDYYLDAPNDYANIDAALVAHYSSRTRDHLLRELEASVAELTAYVGGLNAGELTARRGVVHHSGEPATVEKSLRSLAGDYEEHARQIEAWFRAG